MRQPPQVGSWGKLAPSDGDAAVEGEQARRLPGCCEPSEVVLVVLARPVTVTGTNAPVHAPAAVRGPGFAEEIFERWPPLGGDRADREIHHGAPEVAGGRATRWRSTGPARCGCVGSASGRPRGRWRPGTPARSQQCRCTAPGQARRHPACPATPAPSRAITSSHSSASLARTTPSGQTSAIQAASHDSKNTPSAALQNTQYRVAARRTRGG